MVASFTTPNERTDPGRELRALMKIVGASGMATGRSFGKGTRKSCRQSTSAFNCIWRCARKNHRSSMEGMVSARRQKAPGGVGVGEKKFEVTGTSWMDHEFFTHQLAAEQTGWDWLSLQLEDNTELMLFHIRRRDGAIDPYSAGTYVDVQGKTAHLRAGDFVLMPLGKTWKSPVTGAVYPIEW